MKKNQIGKEILYLRKWILVTVQLKLFHQILIVSIDVDTDDIKKSATSTYSGAYVPNLGCWTIHKIVFDTTTFFLLMFSSALLH